MRIHIDVRIESGPGDSQYTGGYGTVNFGEDVQLEHAGFETVSKVFTRCHELLETIKQEHKKK